MSTRIPKHRRHKSRDMAIVTIAGKAHYLGRWNSDESKAAYRLLIIEHLGQPPATIAGVRRVRAVSLIESRA